MRLPVVLASTGSVLLAAATARELGGDARAQTLTALAQATGVWATLFGHWSTPYSLEPVQWPAIGWLLVRWVRLRDDRLLLALGVVVGIAAAPPPPEELDTGPSVGPDPVELRGSFSGAGQVARIAGEGATDLTGEDVGTPVWLLTGRHEPWAAIWRRERHLDVS